MIMSEVYSFYFVVIAILVITGAAIAYSLKFIGDKPRSIE